MAVQNYRDLEVWQRAMDLVVAVYQQTAAFPREEIYGLTSQLRRAAVSVPSNIAEGQGRRGTREFLNQLSVARGSIQEVQTQIEIGRRLQYLSTDQWELLEGQVITIVRLLNGLINALERKL